MASRTPSMDTLPWEGYLTRQNAEDVFGVIREMVQGPGKQYTMVLAIGGMRPEVRPGQVVDWVSYEVPSTGTARLAVTDTSVVWFLETNLEESPGRRPPENTELTYVKLDEGRIESRVVHGDGHTIYQTVVMEGR